LWVAQIQASIPRLIDVNQVHGGLFCGPEGAKNARFLRRLVMNNLLDPVGEDVFPEIFLIGEIDDHFRIPIGFPVGHFRL
jgi:hypothetical protein